MSGEKRTKRGKTWCEHIKWMFGYGGWIFVSRTGFESINGTCKFCWICGTPRPSTKSTKGKK